MKSNGLMLVSAKVDASLREAVASGHRPRPEYLILEKEYGIELLDWSRVRGSRDGRSPWNSALHAATALHAMGKYQVVFSDGEHVGIPLALAMRAIGSATPHLVIGHHLTSPSKNRAFRQLGAHHGMSRILVHSNLQARLAEQTLGIPRSKLVYTPYYADAEFWRPNGAIEERLIVAAGREHRDYATLAECCRSIDARVFVAAGSVHSPASRTREPMRWPENFEWGFAAYEQLRDLYDRASVVVVPLVDSDFQAGVTTVLEAMCMAKPVVVTTTRGQSAVVQDGVTGICVPPGNAGEMRDAIAFLLDNPAERHRIGEAARAAVLELFSADAYAANLAAHLADLSRVAEAAA